MKYVDYRQKYFGKCCDMEWQQADATFFAPSSFGLQGTQKVICLPLFRLRIIAKKKTKVHGFCRYGVRDAGLGCWYGKGVWRERMVDFAKRERIHLEMFGKYAEMIGLKTIKLQLDILHENFSEIFVQCDEGARRGLGVLHENFTAKFVQDSVLCRVWIHCYAYFTQYEKGRTLTIE